MLILNLYIETSILNFTINSLKCSSKTLFSSSLSIKANQPTNNQSTKMKSFTILCVIAALIAVVSCQQTMGSEKTEPKMRQMKDQQQQGTQENMLGSAYGAPSRGSPAAAHQQAAYSAPAVPAPICQNAYMFSCSPNMAPVPCVRQASYGSAGAYSQFVPQYAFPAEY